MTMTMSFADALLYSLLGISVVFFALVLLILIICVMNIFRKGETKAVPAAAAPMAAAPAAPAAEPVYAPGTAGELKLYDTDERDAAMLMAIIADELGAPLNELRFKSIRELK